MDKLYIHETKQDEKFKTAKILQLILLSKFKINELDKKLIKLLIESDIAR
jgi:hypothetical protein